MLIRRFLYDQLYPNNLLSSSDVPLRACPSYSGKVRVHSSAVAIFHAPSDQSGVYGMHREHIRATKSWRKGPPRYDCVFLNRDPDILGVLGMDIVRVFVFFSFNFGGKTYPCALVHWFTIVGDEPDEDTGMWIVKPEMDVNGNYVASVIHLDCIIRSAHLLGVFGGDFIPKGLTCHQSLDSFKAFYVNKYIDHHAFQLAI